MTEADPTMTTTPDRRLLCAAGAERYVIETHWQETEDSSHEITLVCGPLHSEDDGRSLTETDWEFTESDRTWHEMREEFRVINQAEWQDGRWVAA